MKMRSSIGDRGDRNEREWMMKDQIVRHVLSETESVCPVCLKKIKAYRVAEGGSVWLEKTCPDHGGFCVEVWGDHVPYEEWNRVKKPSAPVNPATTFQRGCPYDCGLCPDHRQHSCCVLLEITERCNLKCPVCFASSGRETADPPIGELMETLADLLTRGGPLNIQLSGGEPTVRDDLPEIIRRGKEMGHPFFQINTNGLRLANEPDYAQILADAGLDCVFLQFDGVSDDVYRKIRGRDLLSVKRTAIERCEEAGVGVVLVPTVCAGINTHEIGAILDFAVENISAVRGVHFQPMTYMGRYPEGAPVRRFTLSHLLYEIERQMDSRMKRTDFSPGGAENAYCSFSASYFVNPDGTLKTKTDPAACGCGCGSPVPEAADRARQARAYVAKAWKGAGRKKIDVGKMSIGGSVSAKRLTDTSSLDNFLENFQRRQLAVSAMYFMDAWNLDLDRLRDCYIHVADGKRLIPFCAYNLTAQNGKTLYRR